MKRERFRTRAGMWRKITKMEEQAIIKDREAIKIWLSDMGYDDKRAVKLAWRIQHPPTGNKPFGLEE
jgi:hypothetical protein